MGGTILSKTVKEKYFGETMNANITNVSEQGRNAGSKGNQVGSREEMAEYQPDCIQRSI